MATKKTTTKKTTKNGVTVTTTTTTTGTTKRKKKKSGTEILPGVTVSFSWKKLLGITKLKRWFTKQTGIPTTEAGIQRKIGKWITDLVTGKNKSKNSSAKKDNLADIDNVQ
jgi:hypothetical protein